MKQLSLFFALGNFVFFGCKQGDPPIKQPPITPFVKGDLTFSGYEWNLKSSGTNYVGPGPNIFNKDSNNIWVDANGMLHLKITKRNGKWYSSEIISQKSMGYGTYIFTTASDLTTLNEKAVLGLFTWDDYSFQTQANSEVDIEFSRWDNKNDSFLLSTSVQPVWFELGPFWERTNRPAMQVSKLKTTCTHVFKWTPTNIIWESYEGDTYPGTNKIASWSYDNTNIPRSKKEGGVVSNPIVIPAPTDSTKARMNLWLFNGAAPINNSETEVVIKSFKYVPL
jgi:hypothetical protein